MLAREWWVWCRMHRVTPLYRWVEREDNTRADELSKQMAGTLKLKPEKEKEIRSWLEGLGLPGLDRRAWEQTRVQAPVYDHIAQRLQEMRRAARPVCIVVPRWQGQVWWADLCSFSVEALALGKAEDVFEESEEAARAREWKLEAHVLLCDEKGRKPKRRRNG